MIVRNVNGIHKKDLVGKPAGTGENAVRMCYFKVMDQEIHLRNTLWCIVYVNSKNKMVYYDCKLPRFYSNVKY